MRVVARTLAFAAVVAAVVSTDAADAAVDNGSRAAVISAYDAEFNRTEPDASWVGSQTDCTAGTTNSAHQASVLQRVNWYRSQAGLPPVVYAAQHTAAAQAAALYQSRQGTLSHGISAGTPCYSAEASEGSARSNLALGSRGVRAIDLYIVDPGANNTWVGHRNWILSTTLGSIATGDVNSMSPYMSANALYVVTPTVPAVTPRDGFVAWPNPGYFPDAIVPTRWSFTPVGTVDFSAAQVTLAGPSGNVPVEIVHNSGYLVFEASVGTRVAADTPYRVKITAGGGSSWTYDVTLVDVNEAPRDAGASSWSELTCAGRGTKVARQIFADDDPLAVKFVTGTGDADNSLFTVDDTGTVRIAETLPLTRTSYSVRLRATDSKGASLETVLRVSVNDPSATGDICPARNVTAKKSGSSIAISWEAPSVGSDFEYFVFVNNGDGYCETKTTTCTARVRGAGPYEIDVRAAKGSSMSRAAVFTLADTATVTDTTVPATDTRRSLARSKSYPVGKVIKIPAGSRTFRTAGRCRMSANRKLLVTSSARGTCKVTVVTSRRLNGRTVRTTTRASFTVA